MVVQWPSLYASALIPEAADTKLGLGHHGKAPRNKIERNT